MVGQILGWIGAICFIVCAVPQAVLCIKQGHTKGLSLWFLLLWFIGEVTYTLAVLLEYGLVLWLLSSYIAGILSLFVIGRYYFWPVCKQKEYHECTK